MHDIAKPQCASMEPDGYMHFYGHPELGSKIAKEILTTLKFSKAEIKTITTLIYYHDEKIYASYSDVAKWLNIFSGVFSNNKEIDFFKMLIVLKSADRFAHKPGFNKTEKIDKLAILLEEILKANAVYKVSQLKISGEDLAKIGIGAGPEMGKLLNKCLEEVMQGKIENSNECLLRHCKTLKKFC